MKVPLSRASKVLSPGFLIVSLLLSVFLQGCTRPEPGDLPGSLSLESTPEEALSNTPTQMEKPPPSPTSLLTGLTIETPNKPLLTGESRQFRVTPRGDPGPPNFKFNLDWTSENPEVASITSAGMVTAISPGETRISVKTDTVTDSVFIQVLNPPIAHLEIRPSVVKITAGRHQSYQVFATDSKGREWSDFKPRWTSRSPSIATVDQHGRVSGIRKGKVRIVADLKNDRVSFRLTVLPIPDPPPVNGATPPVSSKSKNTGSRTAIRLPKKLPIEKTTPSRMLYLSGITGQMAGSGNPESFSGEAEKAGRASHPKPLELSGLPKDRYGLVDWAEALKIGRIKPRFSLEATTQKEAPPLDLDIVIFTKSAFQPDVIFPHKIHTMWLSCKNCHPKIFPMDAKKANEEMTMPRIASGEFCGRCHNRVAFPLDDCLRCHVKPKNIPPLDPNYPMTSQPPP